MGLKPLTDAYYVVRTLRLLELLAFGGCSPREVAAVLQIHPRTARRMLARLCDERYVTRVEGPRPRYELTMHLPALGAQSAANARLPRIAVPVLEGLYARTALTAHLVVPCYDAVLCVAHRASGAVVQSRAGELLPCHCTAAGKVLLAERGKWAAERLACDLPRFTEKTVVDAATLRAQLDAIHAAGLAFEEGEVHAASHGVAAPVHAAHERGVAAVAITAEEPLDMAFVSAEVLSAARDISATLGAWHHEHHAGA